MPHILFILSEATQIRGADGQDHATGYWLEEFAIPYKYFVENGFKITVATPTGKQPVPDPASVEITRSGTPVHWEEPAEFKDGIALAQQLRDDGKIIALSSLSDESLKSFDGVFVPGGYAPMTDLPASIHVGRTLRYFHSTAKPTALFCHGPIALLATSLTPEGFAYGGYQVTSFSSEEEKDTELGLVLVQDSQQALSNAGCQFRKGSNWSSFTIRDRELITGQNTQSTRAIAKEFVALLKEGVQ